MLMSKIKLAIGSCLEQECPAVADKPARHETMRKSAAVRRLNKLQTTFSE